ncbi:MAG: aminotransferase class IV [Chthonomonadales bacterium]|nr:aminotransferase class IV [Chthonomonadales bacterium]
MSDVVYLRNERYADGVFIAREAAAVSPDDRGFVFADGVYEVVRAYGARLFLFEEHMARLRRSLDEARIALTDLDWVEPTMIELIDRSLPGVDEAVVYLQITRGTAPRSHPFPDPSVPPSLYLSAAAVPDVTAARADGLSVITTEDLRWARCDIKAIGLMANVLAIQIARERGAREAVLVRDGYVTEGTHTTFFGVLDGVVRTHPLNQRILAGITRGGVLEDCRAAGIAVREEPIAASDLPRLEEAFLTATSYEVAPIVRIDDRPVADGRPGPLTRRLQGLWRERVARALG